MVPESTEFGSYCIRY